MSYKLHRDYLQKAVLKIEPSNFEALAMEIFLFQAKYNTVYKHYLHLLNIDPLTVNAVHDIPFLPINLFKSHKIQTGTWQPKGLFSSSGTTGALTSKHYYQDLNLYRMNARRAFVDNYGKLSNWRILALLPAYLERKGSSLIFMVDDFIQQSQHPESGFFLDDFDHLKTLLQDQSVPTLLLGVSFALWDLAEQGQLNLSNTIVMETGGMKGRREEITRTHLRAILKNVFAVDRIHSEYGMTELFSQAYSKGNGIFQPSPTMQVLARDVTDPFASVKNGKTGVLQVIDLANIDSISFIATEDLCKCHENGTFEILGRLDNSDIRGCNLLVLND